MHRVKRLLLTSLLLLGIGLTLVQLSGKTHVIKDVVSTSNVAPSKAALKSNRYTQKEDLTPTSNPLVTLNDYEKIASNDVSKLSLYVNINDLSFRVLNEETGYVFGSNVELDYLDETNPNYDPSDQPLNQTWRNRVKSPVSVLYYTGANLQEEYLFQNPGSSFTYLPLNEGDKKGFEANLSFALSKVNLTLRVYIDDQGLSVEIPNDGIKEDPSTLDTRRQLAGVTPYPFFGSTKRDTTTGYVLVPDGVGALMRFEDRPMTGTYSKRFFGNESFSSLSEESLFMNVYGMVHGVNQNGFLAIVEKGSAQASFVYTPSGEPIDLNYANVSFEYRIAYTQYLNQSGTSSVRLVQERRNEYDIKISYRFLSNEYANYVGMAKSYQEELILEGVLTPYDKPEVSLHLDVLMAENKKALFGRKLVLMTTFNQTKQMVEALNDEGINTLDLTLHGFQKGGLSYQGPDYDQIEKKLGGTKALKTLSDFGANVYFQTNYVTAYKEAKGYSMKHVSQSIGQQLISINDDYVLSIKDTISMYESDYKTLSKQGIKNVSFDYLGNVLYRDYSNKGTREDLIDVAKSFLDVSAQSAVSNAFSYLFSADVIKDAPMYSSQQLRFSDTVPFYAYVLQGHQQTYARSANFFSNTQNELLRMVDYHLFPSFFVTNESSYLLLDTNSSNLFTSRFSDWKEEIVRQYHYVNEALSPVRQASILSREVLDDGVVLVSYSNGIKLLINYTGKDYTYQTQVVSATDYEVIL